MSFTEGPLHERSDILVQPPVATVIDSPAQAEVVVPAAVVSGGQVRMVDAAVG